LFPLTTRFAIALARREGRRSDQREDQMGLIIINFLPLTKGECSEAKRGLPEVSENNGKPPLGPSLERRGKINLSSRNPPWADIRDPDYFAFID